MEEKIQKDSLIDRYANRGKAKDNLNVKNEEGKSIKHCINIKTGTAT